MAAESGDQGEFVWHGGSVALASTRRTDDNEGMNKSTRQKQPKSSLTNLTPKKRLTAKIVAKRLREFDGCLAAVGRASGVTRQAVHCFIAKRPVLQRIAKDCRETMKDDAESALHKAVRAGEPWAVCFYLKTQGRDRGYIEQKEHRLAGDDSAPPIRCEHQHEIAPGAIRSIATRLAEVGIVDTTNGDLRSNGDTKPVDS
jgi:hypothetical protein